MTTPTTGHRFPVGATVRWVPALRADWYDGRAAVGDNTDAGIGRITGHTQPGRGYCGLCDHAGLTCDGPHYEVDFGSTGVGAYAEHELEAA